MTDEHNPLASPYWREVQAMASPRPRLRLWWVIVGSALSVAAISILRVMVALAIVVVASVRF